ncbi:hypothetical protein PT285_05985 [Lactobacillus sp. ESL0791]|uniref:hypothetical protein n=1 Tax=Lactobacillus sp. ESL0791 TaxID=2983234 RepID=UPI0023F8295B|nr:hypothetical protein [Lactobacillus sp. ESL0791]MDF7638948.1 hypothetical protein [Lactobacillus sp. ESL0791]
MQLSAKIFKMLFKGKLKTVNWFFIVQILAAITLTLTFRPISEMFFNNFAAIFFVSSFILEALYLIYSSLRAEKLNSNQTWRLIAVSDGQFYLANILSSLMSYIYFGIIQIITFFMLIMLQDVKTNFVLQDIKTIRNIIKDVGVSETIGVLFVIVLIGLTFYLFVSLIDFSSEAIVDFLPISSGKFMVNLIRIIILVIICWIGFQVYNLVWPIIARESLSEIALNLGEYLPGNLTVFLITDIILLATNLLLITKAFEAEPNK